VNRVYHTWEKWECYPAGFYEERAPRGLTKEQAESEYAGFLRDDAAFGAALVRVLEEWPASCEHYLSNENMNRIAWLGQASACLALGLPACFRGGFNRLTESEQAGANGLALEALNRWLASRGEAPHSLTTAASRTQANLY
jgi:hypothetical protein